MNKLLWIILISLIGLSGKAQEKSQINFWSQEKERLVQQEKKIVEDQLDKIRLSKKTKFPSNSAKSIFNGEPYVLKSDSLALVSFYNSTNGDSWYVSDNWLIGPVHEWYGIKVNNGRVRSLNMDGNNITGSLPADIGNLSALDTVSLYDNQIGGSIPSEIGNWTELSYLDLDINNFTGVIPDMFGQLTKLKTLFIGGNPNITGTIPPSLENATEMEILQFYSTGLEGTIPSFFGNFSKLTYLYIARNPSMSSTIPVEIGNLTNLEMLAFHMNNIYGSIPAELGQLTNLESIYLYANLLSGEIPASLGQLSNLTTLSLGSNVLTGSIPVELGNLAALKILYLWGNNLSGGIPAELGQLSNLTRLSLSANSLEGNIPEALGNLSSLEALFLSENNLSGAIPLSLENLSNIRSIYLWDNQLDGTIPDFFEALDSLRVFNCEVNSLVGPIPASIASPPYLHTMGFGLNPMNGPFPEGFSGRQMINLFLADCGLQSFPDMTDFYAAKIFIENNDLSFDDLLDANLSLSSADYFSYWPQHEIEVTDNFIFNNPEDEFSIDLNQETDESFSHPENDYDWYKGSNLVYNVKGSSVFSLSEYSSDDDGEYSVLISNSAFPELDIATESFSVTVNETVDIDEQEFPELLIYPNPASLYLSVSFPEEASYYRITDMRGVISVAGKPSTESIDIQQLIPGYYIFEIGFQDRAAQRTKFLKTE